MGTFDKVLQAVGSEYGQQRHSLLAGTRGRQETAHARQVAMYLTCLLTGDSLTAVGKLFGRDRSTVRFARDKVGEITGNEARRIQRMADRLRGRA